MPLAFCVIGNCAICDHIKMLHRIEMKRGFTEKIIFSHTLYIKRIYDRIRKKGG